jgi:hypothetical protein
MTCFPIHQIWGIQPKSRISLMLGPVLCGSAFLREPLVRFRHFKIYVMILRVWVWARFSQNLNPSVPVLSCFFKFKNL